MKGKRIITVIAVLALLVGLIIPTAVSADVAEEVIPLFAGQDWQVGNVYISNDTENVYVRYELFEVGVTAEGWFLTETHLAVETDFEEIPTTKKGSPIPGHFEEGDYFDIALKKDMAEYSIPYEGPMVYIAAHAVVEKLVPVEGCWETVWMIGNVEATDPDSGLLSNYADEFNWAGATPTTVGPGLSAVQPAFTNPFTAGVTPDSEFPYNSNKNKNYATDIDVQWEGALPFGGVLTVSWSPGQSAAEVKKIDVSGDSVVEATLTAVGAPAPGEGWFLDKYPLVEDVVVLDELEEGLNVINFTHTSGDGTFWDWIKLEKPCETTIGESAWAEGTRFVEKGNWATYFEYDLQMVLVDSVSVPAYSSEVRVPVVVDSNIVLADGGTYMLEASGVADAQNGRPILFDADNSLTTQVTDDEWTDVVTGYESYGDELLDLFVNGASVDWIGSSDTHIYNLDIIGDGSAVSFYINDIYCTNNSGTIEVDIYWIP